MGLWRYLNLIQIKDIFSEKLNKNKKRKSKKMNVV